jgi:hypothetical protein
VQPACATQQAHLKNLKTKQTKPKPKDKDKERKKVFLPWGWNPASLASALPLSLQSF